MHAFELSYTTDKYDTYMHTYAYKHNIHTYICSDSHTHMYTTLTGQFTAALHCSISFIQSMFLLLVEHSKAVLPINNSIVVTNHGSS